MTSLLQLYILCVKKRDSYTLPCAINHLKWKNPVMPFEAISDSNKNTNLDANWKFQFDLHQI